MDELNILDKGMGMRKCVRRNIHETIPGFEKIIYIIY